MERIRGTKTLVRLAGSIALAVLALLGAYVLVFAQLPGEELYYKFDGDLQDSSGNGHTGTAYGSPTYVTGIVSQALKFDGSDDYVSATYSSQLSNWTISVWISATSVPSDYGNSYVVYRDGNYALQWDHVEPGNQGSIGFRDTNSGDFLTVTFDIGGGDVGNWIQLAGTWDGTELRAYKDCGLTDVYTPSDASVRVTDEELGIATGHYDGAEHFAGTIDEVRIWDQALTQDQITGICDGTTSVDVRRVDTAGGFDARTLSLGLAVVGLFGGAFVLARRAWQPADERP